MATTSDFLPASTVNAFPAMLLHATALVDGANYFTSLQALCLHGHTPFVGGQGVLNLFYFSFASHQAPL